jgi:hypothetical protein
MTDELERHKEYIKELRQKLRRNNRCPDCDRNIKVPNIAQPHMVRNWEVCECEDKEE